MSEGQVNARLGSELFGRRPGLGRPTGLGMVEADPYRQYREGLFDRHADMERRLAVLSPWARERAAVLAVAAAEVVADEPFLATASRSAQ